MEKTVRQRVVIRCVDRQKFVDTIVEMAQKGAVRSYNTVPRMIMPFSCEMVLDVDPRYPVKATPYLYPLPYDIPTYSPEQLEVMVWEEFREACAMVGVKGRDRKKMIEDYLEAIKNRR